MTDLLPLTGEPLALDLVNTRPRGPDGPVDLLADASGLGAWVALEADRLPGFPAEEAATAADDLAPIHAVRDHVAGALDRLRRGEAPRASDLQGLNRWAGAAPAVRAIGWSGSTVTTVSHRTGPFALRLAAHLADAAIDLLSDPTVHAIRACAAEDCVMLFLPTHPRRRWCSATRCGNRVRVARYYRRHKTA